MTDQADTELDMLRVFYARWVDLHKIPRDAIHRRKAEAAAQELVDAAHVLRFFYCGSGLTGLGQDKPKLELVVPGQ